MKKRQSQDEDFLQDEAWNDAPQTGEYYNQPQAYEYYNQPQMGGYYYVPPTSGYYYPAQANEYNNGNDQNGDAGSSKKKPRKPRRVVTSIIIAIVCFIGGALTTWFSLDKQMRSLLYLKWAIQDHYYEQVSDETFYDTLFGAINDQLLDSYSQYLTAEEYAEMQMSGKGNQSGLGIVFSTKDKTGADQMRIIRVCGNSPAEAAGLQAGDYIIGFGRSQDSVKNSVSFDEFSLFLSGVSTGVDVCLKLQNGADVRYVTLQKQAYVENYVFYRTNTQAYRFTGNKATQLIEGGSPLTALPEHAAYIRLTQFNGNAVAQFEQAMDLFRQQGKKTLVLDLRQNGGGYVDILNKIAGYFCKTSTNRTPLVGFCDYGEKTERFYADKNVYNDYFAEDSRICVLADDGTASASEALMGCMLDYGAVKYSDICLTENDGVAKTYGKGIMQTTFPFGAGNTDAVKLTTARILWPLSRTCIHDRGVVKADGTKSVPLRDVDEEQINAALAVLFA